VVPYLAYSFPETVMSAADFSGLTHRSEPRATCCRSSEVLAHQGDHSTTGSNRAHPDRDGRISF